MAAFPPDISEAARGVLRVILDNKIIRGGDLMRRTGITNPQLLLPPLEELLRQGLIEVTGDLAPDALPFATFGTPPSAQEYLRAIVQRR